MGVIGMTIEKERCWRLSKFTLPEQIRKIVNVKREDGSLEKKLQQISDENVAVLIAFIAPYGGVRVSPIEERSAAIRMPEEWGVEYVLTEIVNEHEDIKKCKLYLLINSPGGIPACSYNIAYMLQECFGDIKVFVPQLALSGGTLLALSGNNLVMGAASRLSPIDVQVPYFNSTVSAYSMGKALSRLNKYFSTRTVDEAPYPYRAMADKLDPVILEDWSTALNEVGIYANELLEKAGYSKERRESIIKALVLTENTHSFVVHNERAKSIGLNVSEDKKDLETLNIMREWLAEYAFEKEATHCIRYIIPKRRKDNGEDKGACEGTTEGETKATNE
jgi:hypothetical protein